MEWIWGNEKYCLDVENDIKNNNIEIFIGIYIFYKI